MCFRGPARPRRRRPGRDPGALGPGLSPDPVEPRPDVPRDAAVAALRARTPLAGVHIQGPAPRAPSSASLGPRGAGAAGGSPSRPERLFEPMDSAPGPTVGVTAVRARKEKERGEAGAEGKGGGWRDFASAAAVVAAVQPGAAQESGPAVAGLGRVQAASPAESSASRAPGPTPGPRRGRLATPPAGPASRPGSWPTRRTCRCSPAPPGPALPASPGPGRAPCPRPRHASGAPGPTHAHPPSLPCRAPRAPTLRGPHPRPRPDPFDPGTDKYITLGSGLCRSPLIPADFSTLGCIILGQWIGPAPAQRGSLGNRRSRPVFGSGDSRTRPLPTTSVGRPT